MSNITKENENSNKRYKRTSARDIGDIPVCKDPINRIKCDTSLLYFLKYCFPERFYKEFGPAHIDYINSLQDIIENGGLKAIGCSRSTGKTVISQLAVLWSAISGKRSYSLFVCINSKKAREANKAIATALQTNDTLLDLYPESTYPIRCLEGSAGRARSQLFKGRPTLLEFGKLIRFATVGGISDGSVININSISSGIRGEASVRSDGTYIRPSLVVIDDIVNDKTASSPAVQEGLKDIIENSILYLAGVGNKISVAFVGTIVSKHDVVAEYLDVKKHPLWRGVKIPALYSMPTNMELWERYKLLLIEDVADGKSNLANEFYIKNRKDLDAGAVASWEDRKDPNDTSAIEWAMKKWAENEQSFLSELQLCPNEKTQHLTKIKEEELTTSICELKRGELPLGDHIVCVGVDVNAPALSWVVTAHTQEAVYVIDYGTTPESPNRYFSLDEKFPITLERRFPANSLEGSIKQGLAFLMQELYTKYKPNITLVDRGFSLSIVGVSEVCAEWQKKTGNVYLPAKGSANGARSSATFADSKKTPGTTIDPAGIWKIFTKNVNGAFIMHETDLNKSQVYRLIQNNRVKTYNPYTPNPINWHKLFFEHLRSQYPIAVEVLGDVKLVWEKDKSHNGQDHFFDAILLCNVGASVLGHKTFKSYAAKKAIKEQKQVEKVKTQNFIPPSPSRIQIKW